MTKLAALTSTTSSPCRISLRQRAPARDVTSDRSLRGHCEAQPRPNSSSKLKLAHRRWTRRILYHEQSAFSILARHTSGSRDDAFKRWVSSRGINFKRQTRRDNDDEAALKGIPVENDPVHWGSPWRSGGAQRRRLKYWEVSILLGGRGWCATAQRRCGLGNRLLEFERKSRRYAYTTLLSSPLLAVRAEKNGRANAKHEEGRHTMRPHAFFTCPRARLPSPAEWRGTSCANESRFFFFRSLLSAIRQCRGIIRMGILWDNQRIGRDNNNWLVSKWPWQTNETLVSWNKWMYNRDIRLNLLANIARTPLQMLQTGFLAHTQRTERNPTCVTFTILPGPAKHFSQCEMTDRWLQRLTNGYISFSLTALMNKLSTSRKTPRSATG